jgi:hypothetical protein
MKIINDKIKCENEYEQYAIEALLFPEVFAYEYMCEKSKKYYNKLLTNPKLCDIIKSTKREEK